MSTPLPATSTPTMTAPTSAPATTLESLPAEIMTMIMQAPELRESDSLPEKVVMPILGSSDIFALRLSSRQLESTMTDGFVRRYFSVRKHMLSRRSVDCLLDIAASPKFGPHIRELAFGPERLNPDLANYINDEMYIDLRKESRTKRENRKRSQKEWNDTYQDTWQTLMQEQIAFDSECVAHLDVVLRHLPCLQQVRLDGCPTEDGAWRNTWGAVSLVRAMGLPEKEDWFDMDLILDDEDHRSRGLPAHFETVLRALEGIEGRENWTLAIAFDTSEGEFQATPEYLNTGLWRQSRNRVRSLEFIETFQNGDPEVDDEFCLIDYFDGCSNLTKLTCKDVNALNGMSHILSVPAAYHLQHLILLETKVPNESLTVYLEEHKQTLKKIDFREVTLIPPENLGLKQNDTYTTWITVFEIMLGMPGLRAVQMEKLRQKYTSGEAEHIHLVNRGRFCPHSRDLAAYASEVAPKLSRAVRESDYIRMPYNGLLAELQNFPSLRNSSTSA